MIAHCKWPQYGDRGAQEKALPAAKAQPKRMLLRTRGQYCCQAPAVLGYPLPAYSLLEQGVSEGLPGYNPAPNGMACPRKPACTHELLRAGAWMP